MSRPKQAFDVPAGASAQLVSAGSASAARGGRARASAPAPGTEPPIPDFFIVGHAKSGTSALYEMLRTHPEIHMPAAKEPWFFSTDMRPRFQPPRAGVQVQTLDDYRALFKDAQPGQRVGEASSSYLWSRTAARQIARVQPRARNIAILREPASFLRSLHMQLLRTHVESEKHLAKALALEPARRVGRDIPRRCFRPLLLQYSDHVRYVDQLRRYRAAFPDEQLLVLIYDDFRADNEATVRSVFRFLGVDDTRVVNAIEVNPTVGMRSQQLDELVHAVSVGRGPLSRAAKRMLKTLAPHELRSRAVRSAQQRLVYTRPDEPDQELLLQLRRRFKAEVAALSEYLDRDLITLWGYGDLD